MSLRSRLIKYLQVKENPVNRIILMTLGKDALFSTENYTNLSTAGYKNCITAYACIKQITNNAAGLEWAVEDRSGKAVDSHPFLDLLNSPNEYQGKRAFLIELLSHLLLTGNAYVLQASGLKVEMLYNLRPDRVSVLPGSGAELVRGYRYTVSGQYQDYTTQQVRHIKLFNPTNDFYGMGPVSAAARAIDISNYSDVWNAAIIKNDMKPPGAFSTDMTLTDSQIDSLRNQVEEQYGGADNAGRPLLLHGGMKFTPFSMSPKDLDWLNSNKANLRSICAAFGWPSQLLGDTEASTYSNYQEARRAAHMDCILPLMDYLTDELQSWLLPTYGQGLKLKIKREKIDALQENQNDKYSYLEQCTFLTINEKREAVNKDSIGPDGDTIMVRLGLTPLADAVAPPEPVPAALAPAATPDPNIVDGTVVDETAPDAAGKSAIQSKGSYWSVPERKQILWKSFDMRVKAREKTFEQIAKEYLRRQAESVAAKVSNIQLLESINAASILDVTEETKKYVKQFTPWYIDHCLRAINAGVQATKGELFDDASYKADKPKPTSWVADMTQEQTKKLRQMIMDTGSKVNETAKEAVAQLIIKANEENWTVNEFSDAIQAKVGDWEIWRSKLWARTESVKIDSFGQLEGYKQTEFVDTKIWICSNVPDSRDWHIEADDQEQPLDDPFDVGGESLQYPGDGSPANSCNCLCSIAPKVGEL